MIGARYLYPLMALFALAVAGFNLRDRTNDRRSATASFWSLLAILLLVGDLLPKALVGLGVVVLALLAATKGVKGGAGKGLPPEARAASAQRLGGRLLWPALGIPVLTVLLLVGVSKLSLGGRPLLDPGSGTLVALAASCLMSLGMALILTRDTPRVALGEGRRLLDAIGWAALLPMLLATLGAVFTQAGVGSAVAHVLQQGLPLELRWVALVAFAVGMAALTMVMGNAFAAFPVMMAGIGLPVLVQGHGANPAALAAIGMLTGYCGTLLTPMAANFNLIPAALLELRDPHGVIRAQAPTALWLWLANLLLMAVLVFR